MSFMQEKKIVIAHIHNGNIIVLELFIEGNLLNYLLILFMKRDHGSRFI